MVFREEKVFLLRFFSPGRQNFYSQTDNEPFFWAVMGEKETALGRIFFSFPFQNF
jgi:hypothetical protein